MQIHNIHQVFENSFGRRKQNVKQNFSIDKYLTQNNKNKQNE
jgi:hypothetical protein